MASNCEFNLVITDPELEFSFKPSKRKDQYLSLAFFERFFSVSQGGIRVPVLGSNTTPKVLCFHCVDSNMGSEFSVFLRAFYLSVFCNSQEKE